MTFLLAMDELKTLSASGVTSFIPEIWIKSGSGRPSVADLAVTFISCLERKRGQWRGGGKGPEAQSGP